MSAIKKTVLLSGLLISSALAGAEAFSDPGFESGACAWKTRTFRYHNALKPVWKLISVKTTGMKVQSKTVRTGKYALTVFNQTPYGYIQLYPPAIPVSEGKRYSLRYFVYNASTSSEPTAILTDLYFDNETGHQVWRLVR